MASHLLAAAGIARLGLGVLPTSFLLMALGAHARWRWPRSMGWIARGADGLWWLESAGDRGMTLAPDTAFDDWWADLRFRDGSHSLRAFLCRDQLSTEAWRRLIVTLRRERQVVRLP